MPNVIEMIGVQDEGSIVAAHLHIDGDRLLLVLPVPLSIRYSSSHVFMGLGSAIKY